MKKALLTLVLALCSAPAWAASSAHCDATPFTLGKPATAVPSVKSDQPKPKPQAPAIATTPQVKPEGKQRLLANCKAGKARKKGG